MARNLTNWPSLSSWLGVEFRQGIQDRLRKTTFFYYYTAVLYDNKSVKLSQTLAHFSEISTGKYVEKTTDNKHRVPVTNKI
jgi:hypothetical protein